jgi:hypothetical protein
MGIKIAHRHLQTNLLSEMKLMIMQAEFINNKRNSTERELLV